jgi:hypothetical protein
MTTLLSYEAFVDECNRELCEKLRGFEREGRKICVPEWMQFYAFDVIGAITVSIHTPPTPRRVFTERLPSHR